MGLSLPCFQVHLALALLQVGYDGIQTDQTAQHAGPKEPPALPCPRHPWFTPVQVAGCLEASWQAGESPWPVEEGWVRVAR